MAKIYKSISYAEPNSCIAKQLGHDKTGCYYVQQKVFIDDVEHFRIAPSSEGFLDPDAPELATQLHEAAGEINVTLLFQDFMAQLNQYYREQQSQG